jgi:hypothetical protein
MSTLTAPMASTVKRASGLATGSLLIAQFVLMWTAFSVLSSAINWPASLGDPASIALPRLLDNEAVVMFGYGFYLMTALLMVPATAAFNARFGLTGAYAATTLTLGTVCAVAKMIGITRWLFVMPSLARAFVAPDADQATISLIFNVLNDYAGGIGEAIGVGLVGGVWTILIGLAVVRSGSHFVGWFAVVMGVTLLATLPAVFGVELGPILTISNVGWQFALFAIAIVALRGSRT